MCFAGNEHVKCQAQPRSLTHSSSVLRNQQTMFVRPAELALEATSKSRLIDNSYLVMVIAKRDGAPCCCVTTPTLFLSQVKHLVSAPFVVNDPESAPEEIQMEYTVQPPADYSPQVQSATTF